MSLKPELCVRGEPKEGSICELDADLKLGFLEPARYSRIKRSPSEGGTNEQRARQWLKGVRPPEIISINQDRDASTEGGRRQADRNISEVLGPLHGPSISVYAPLPVQFFAQKVLLKTRRGLDLPDLLVVARSTPGNGGGTGSVSHGYCS